MPEIDTVVSVTSPPLPEDFYGVFQNLFCKKMDPTDWLSFPREILDLTLACNLNLVFTKVNFSSGYSLCINLGLYCETLNVSFHLPNT